VTETTAYFGSPLVQYGHHDALVVELGAFDQRASLEGAGAEQPMVLFAGDRLYCAGLPDGLAIDAVIGEGSDLGDGSAIGLLGQRDLRDRTAGDAWHDRGDCHLGYTDEHVVAIRADAAGAGFHDVSGVLALLLQQAAAGQQVLAQRADEITFIRYAVEVLRVQVDALAGQHAEIEVGDGVVDGVRDQQLLRGRARRVGEACGAATAGQTGEQKHLPLPQGAQAKLFPHGPLPCESVAPADLRIGGAVASIKPQSDRGNRLGMKSGVVAIYHRLCQGGPVGGAV
jgi:hypothetical protein